MSAFSFLVAWYNIPFLVALGCCLIFAALQVFAGGDNDSDADVDADVDIDADVDVDVDVAGPDHAGSGVVGAALSALGVGRVPLLLVLTAFLGLFGALGLFANSLISNVAGGYPEVAFAPMLLGGILLALFLTGRLSNLLARLAPNSSTAISAEQLVGRSGVVVSPVVSATYGRVSVRDSFGTLHTVFAVAAGDEPLPEQSEVALLSYDSARRHFVVRPLRRLP